MEGTAILPRPRKRPRRCKPAAPLSLPLDLLPEVAARSDPVTLVRCAATCKELRRHIAGPAFRGRLRRHADQRFVRPSLLRGGLVDQPDGNLTLVDTATAKPTRLLRTAACFPAGADAAYCRPLAARDGLILVQGMVELWHWHEEKQLCVYRPTTGRSQALPPGPRIPGQYVLLVGDGGAVGRPFQVLKACFVTPPGGWRSLQIHAFSSERGAWAPLVRSSSPLIMHGDEELHRPGNPVVVGDTVQWLYHLNQTYYVLKLHVGAARLTLTEVPNSFHRACRSLSRSDRAVQILMATSPSGRSPVVLVANGDVVSAWAQSERTGKWGKRPAVGVVRREERRRARRGAGLHNFPA